jgi:hypothetical protein
MPSPVAWLATFLFVVLVWVLFRAPDFGTAVRVYEGLFGLSGLAGEFKWRAIAAAAAFAMFGPTSWVLVHKLPPHRWIAVLFAVLFVIVLFKIGDDANYEFIYFQF